MNDYKIGFIGGGNMALSLIGGLVPGTLDAGNVLVGEPDADKRDEITSRFGIRCFADNSEVIRACDVLLLAVKPQVIGDVLRPVADAIADTRPLIVSIVAGIRIDTINTLLGRDHAVIRTMPNTPALVGRGASGMYAGAGVSEQQITIAETLIGAVGIAEWVDSESDIDTVTALSGSGPAYFMLFMQALRDAAVKAGLDSESAHRLTVETAAGAAELVRQSPESLDELIRRVTSPGGTTEQALKSLRENDLVGIAAEALDAARVRSEQLAVELAPPDTDTG